MILFCFIFEGANNVFNKICSCYRVFMYRRKFRRLTKIFYELGDPQKVLNMDIPWHNWLILGFKSPNIFCFVLFEIIRLQKTYKHVLWAKKPSGSPHYGYSLAQLARFGFKVSKHFLFGLIWDYKTSRHYKIILWAGRSSESSQ
jgi:hypothetical protein